MPICPICTAAVATCVGLSRWLGVDDTISGTWIGGLIVSGILWILIFLDKKDINFKFRNILVAFLTYLTIIIPLYWFDIIGSQLNKSRFFGIDKLVLGIFMGSIFFFLSLSLNNWLRKRNQGKSLFPFQKVIVPVLFLLVLSLIFYQTC